LRLRSNLDRADLRVEDNRRQELGRGGTVLPVEFQPQADGSVIILVTAGEKDTGEFRLEGEGILAGEEGPVTEFDPLLFFSAPLQPLANVAVPKAIQVGTPLAMEKHPVDPFEFQRYRLSGEPIQSVVWSQDREAFFLLTAKFEGPSKIRRIRVDGFVEECRIQLQYGTFALFMSEPGPTLVIPSLNEVWVFDAKSLEVKTRIGV